MADVTASRQARTAAWIVRLHDDLTEFFERLDAGGSFREDDWERPGGGGGTARVLTEGETFEKAGINRSVVSGEFTPELAGRLQTEVGNASRFFATGVSLVVHPRSPLVPTVHLNVRYFELTDGDGAVQDAWIGGGTDLTPTYPFPEDAAHFHRALRDHCDRHDPSFYPRFKTWCDAYFVNAHRRGEARGVGGIFFDHLRPGPDRHFDGLLAFADDIARVLPVAYEPLVERRRGLPWGDRERRLQLLRRGRYAEFNLLHDRGTIFGLRTEARIESVLMSLPPLAAWEYDPVIQPGSLEWELQEMLKPRDWAG